MVSTHLEICSSKLDHFSKFSVCKKHIWNHHLVHYCNHISATWLWLWNVGLWNVENIHPFVFWSPQTNPSCLMSVSRVSPGLFLKPIVRGSMGGTVSLSTWMFDFFMVNSQQKQGLFMGKHYKTRVDKHPTNFLSRIASYTAKLCEQHNILKEFHEFATQKHLWKKTATPLSSLTWQTGKIPISNRTYTSSRIGVCSSDRHVSFPGGGVPGTPKNTNELHPSSSGFAIITWNNPKKIGETLHHQGTIPVNL